jgi:pSer/pThr/pTyr-binding forkhead associated (FHA) protein
MAKIILAKSGKILQEIALIKERVTIGRRPYNDVVIEDVAISGEHAVIAMNLNDALLEDLNSTNGTQVNGQPIKKHFLQNQDVIELADYRLQYVADTSASDLAAIDVNVDLILNNIYPEMWDATATPSVKPRSVCAIKLLTGAIAGKEIDLAKPLTTLGQPGLQVAAIARHAHGYCLSHVEGEVYPMINGHSIGMDACFMSHGDVIDLAGMRLKFLAY